MFIYVVLILKDLLAFLDMTGHVAATVKLALLGFRRFAFDDGAPSFDPLALGVVFGHVVFDELSAEGCLAKPTTDRQMV